MDAHEIESLKSLARSMGEKWEHSQIIEGNCNLIHNPEWWKYKLYVKQIEKAEIGAGIEEYFAKQNLNFTKAKPEDIQSVYRVTAGGDMMPGIPAEALGHLWDDIAPFFFSGDTIYANLESPFPEDKEVSAPGPATTGKPPVLSGGRDVFHILCNRDRGVNFVSTANNHSMDAGESGLLETISLLKKSGIPFVGTAKSPAERDDVPVLEKNGIKIAFLSYTFGTNGKEIPAGKEYLVNYLRLNLPDTDISFIQNHAKIARRKSADIVIALLHWSLEFEAYPIKNVIRMGHRIIDEAGVDVILGNHPHVIQTMEKYHSADPLTGVEKDAFIVYSMGNLIADFNDMNFRISLTLALDFVKDKNGRVFLNKLQTKPLYVWKQLEGGKVADFRLLDFRKLIGQLDKGENIHGLNPDEIQEAYRLKKLCDQLIIV